jgi:hypothetical protein
LARRISGIVLFREIASVHARVAAGYRVVSNCEMPIHGNQIVKNWEYLGAGALEDDIVPDCSIAREGQNSAEAIPGVMGRTYR